MKICRRDLGVDIVVLPSRGLVVIHPDLTYGQAMGAVRKALPDMAASAVAELVSRVSRPPQSIDRELHRRTAAGVGAAVAAMILVGAPTTAHAGNDAGGGSPEDSSVCLP